MQSRTYFGDVLIPLDGKRVAVSGGLWFNRFIVQNNADWFLQTGLRVLHPKKWEKAGIKDVSWGNITLAFNNDEMKKFMDNVKQRKDPTKDDRSFAFHYDDKGNIYQTRGCPVNGCVNQFLLENRIEEIKNSLR